MARPDDLPLLILITTGGTIAMTRDPVSNAPVPAIDGQALLAGVPDIDRIARVDIQNFSNIPSDYITPEDWRALYVCVNDALLSPDVAGVIVSHGTDTLEETAYFLDLSLNNRKPVVLFGAQRNASEPDYDGARNLLCAARVAIAAEAVGKGVLVAMNHQIHAAREVSKTHTTDLDGFMSGNYGMLGSVDDSGVSFYRAPVRPCHIPLSNTALDTVSIVPMYAGADGLFIEAAIAVGVKGLVVQALGLGHVNQPVFNAIKLAIASGIQVVISTRSANGRVLPLYGFEGGGKTLQVAGAIFAGNLSPQKARILLMLALQHSRNADDIQALFWQ